MLALLIWRLLEIDSLQAQQISNLRHQLSNFKRQHTHLKYQMKSIEADHDLAKHIFQKDYDDLKYFFPNVNIKALQDIESFHKQLKGILTKEFKENTDSLQSVIDLISVQIESINEQIASINTVPNVSQAILEKYAEVQKELSLIQNTNKNFEKAEELHQNVIDLTERLYSTEMNILSVIQSDINVKMNDLNKSFYNGKKTSPIITIKNPKSYSFITPSDGGTGTQYKGLVIFDLAMLELTNIPVIAHDSILLKQIEDETLEKILELYLLYDKQIFISLDKEGSYTKRSQEILKQTEVLRLYKDGGELFGWAWNNK